MEDEFSKKTELLSALTGIKEKLDAVHIDVPDASFKRKASEKTARREKIDRFYFRI